LIFLKLVFWIFKRERREEELKLHTMLLFCL